MAAFERTELERAFAHYCELRERSSASGDWSIWAAQFTDDARYVEHAYGEFRGRAAIEAWIVGVMAPFPHMTFPNDWSVVDPERGWVIFQCQNRLEHPTDAGGPPFQFPTWTRLDYAGDLRWGYEEDVYNPKHASDTVRAWLRAGGRLREPERVEMKHR